MGIEVIENFLLVCLFVWERVLQLYLYGERFLGLYGEERLDGNKKGRQRLIWSIVVIQMRNDNDFDWCSGSSNRGK